MTASQLKEKFAQGEYNELLAQLYADASQVDYQQRRYMNALDRFMELYGDQEVQIFSSAGRSEVSGNHTDHQYGDVLAASINLDSIAVAAPCEGEIKVVSDGFDIDPIDLNDLEIREAEFGTSEALIRGVACGMKEAGYNIGGFKAFVTSDVLMGAGLSSSASFEVLMGVILSGLYNNDEADLVEIAKISQMAENKFFGKPCGLMDQCACAIGGLITISFYNPEAPKVHPVDTDFSRYGYSLCIVDTKGDHADLTHEYAAIPQEMKSVAQFFGQETLSRVHPDQILPQIDALRKECGDRAVLRALHFFNENKRVPEIVAALENDDFEGFLTGIQDSGNSSFKYLQNVFAASDPHNQAVSLALAVSENALQDQGVCRVHGGGFAGTIQAFVRNEAVAGYKEAMEQLFGPGSCHVLQIRPKGGTRVI